MRKVKPYEATYQHGIISIENYVLEPRQGLPENPLPTRMIEGNLGIQISSDGRVWVCINGVSFLRFKPNEKECLED